MLDVLSDDFTFTKRHIGVVLITAGAILAAGMIAAEWLDPESGGFGLVQQLGALAGIGAVLLGIPLLPLGDQPA